MPFNPKISDHVLCERLGPGEFKILSEDDKHFNLMSMTTQKKEHIYKAHCHLTHDLMRANHERRVARANNIGKKKG